MKLLKDDLTKNWESTGDAVPDILYMTKREGHKITVLDRQTGIEILNLVIQIQRVISGLLVECLILENIYH